MGPPGVARRRSWQSLLVLSALMGALAACSDGGDGTGSPDTTAQGASPAAAEVPALPAPSTSGTGTVVVGGTTSSFALITCRLEPDPAEPTGARALAFVEGAGTTASGVAFTVELQRFATGADVVTYTDTVTYADSARVLQAQRIEVAGQVTDLRDAKATSSLIRIRADGVTAAGLAGAPGDAADDEGIIGLALDATCP